MDAPSRPADFPSREPAAARNSGMEPLSGLTGEEARIRLLREGPNEVPPEKPHPVLRFLGKFWGLSAGMIELIALISLFLHKMADFWISLALLLVNAVLSFLQEERAAGAVAALRSRLQVSARALRDGSWMLIPARELVREDVVRLRAGDFVPADMRILQGDLRVDRSTLTGESVLVSGGPGDSVYSGSIIRRGEATAVVTATGSGTLYGRTTHLVESAHHKLHVEEITSGLVKRLFVIVGALTAVTLVVSLLRDAPLPDVLPLSLVLLMSAIPVALPVMFTVSTAIGTMELGRRGVLVTRLAAVEDAANMDVLCADKTGTLTANRLALEGILACQGFSDDDVVRAGAWASNPADQDPVDLAFLREASRRGFSPEEATILSYVPFSPEARRTEAVVETEGGRVRVVKGALRTLAEMAGLPDEKVAEMEARAVGEAEKGARVLAVGRGPDGGPPHFLGLVFLRDAPRPESHRLIGELRSLGVQVKMLTGDGLPVARETARELGLGSIVRAPDLHAVGNDGGSSAAEIVSRSGGFAEVFPEDKLLVVRGLQAAGHMVGMTGDGVNDAPALAQAEVGIAVTGATDVAKGAAGVVLTAEGLSGILDLVTVGRSVYQRILTWVINKVSRTILKAGFVVISYLVTGRFVISALGMMLLVFITDFVKIALSADPVRPSRSPETWRIQPLVTAAVILGLLMMGETLGLLALGLRVFDLEGNRLHTFSFLMLHFFALFSIVSIRERLPFWSSRPGRALTTALLGSALAGAAVGVLGLGALPPLPPGQVLFVFVGALFFSLGINDPVKTVLIRRLWLERRGGPPETVPVPGAGE